MATQNELAQHYLGLYEKEQQRAAIAEAKLAALDPDKIVEAVWNDIESISTELLRDKHDICPNCNFGDWRFEPGTEADEPPICCECGTNMIPALTVRKDELRAAIERAVKEVMG